MKNSNLNIFFKILIAISIPFVAYALQSFFWTVINPFAWFLFFPAVFFSSWIGGFYGGMLSTLISTALAWWFFIPPVNSFEMENPFLLGSIGMFFSMGLLFSLSHERLHRANRKTAEALTDARIANDRIKEANEKITHLYERTRELDELKTQFFANVSHELRTPLTLILGPISKHLSSGMIADDVHHDLEVVDRNARLLYRQVTDLLDVSKLEAGQMRMRYVKTDLSRLTRFVAAHFDVIAEEKGIAFQVVSPQTFPAQVDPEKIQRVQLNLLSNAFKFTPYGGKISIELKNEEGKASISVWDTGPGIPVHLRESIFERFCQVEGGAERRYGGTGLGLAIVKEFTGLHGGEVSVGESTDGGALFTVLLPIAAPEGVEIESEGGEISAEEFNRLTPDELILQQADMPVPASPAPAEAPLVLVVEDNRDMNSFLVDTLKVHYRVASAFDGQEGLRKALEIRPNLILSDVMMPVMGGERMVLNLRTHQEMDNIPIVILSAKADDALRVRLLKEGIQDYIIKPFSAEELLARLSGLISQHRRISNQLGESEQRYQNSEERYQHTLDNMMEGFQIISSDWKYLYLNDTAARYGMRNKDELIDHYVTECYPGIENTELFSWMKKCMENKSYHRMEDEFQYPDGQRAWFEFSILPVPEGIAILTLDITQRKYLEEKRIQTEKEIRQLNDELEKRVKERTTQLEVANKELEAFSFSVSHDLRAPLRSIDGFSLLMLEDYAEKMDDEGKDYLNRIRNASTRMGQLIDDLLMLSRITRSELNIQEVDLGVIAHEIFVTLMEQSPVRDVQFNIAPGLTAHADPRLLRVALENLLGNAFKFTGKQDKALIYVGAIQEDGNKTYFVRDNGAGFNQAYSDKLFGAFQRLHDMREFPGTGIGLAIVQRIVHKHGGRIWAEGAVNQGATFYFTL